MSRRSRPKRTSSTRSARLYRRQINVGEQVDSVIKEFDTGEIDFGSESGDDDEDISIEQLRELSEEAPVIKLANLIISRGINDGGSDIHIEPAKEFVRVRLRVDGILQEIMRVPKKVQASLISRFKIMAEMDIATKRSPQDGRIGAVIDGRQFDFRVSTLPSVYGEKIVLRILDKSSVSVGLHKLGMLPETMEKFEGLISRTYGIILVTGPTGSGKSTTLYSVLSKLNSGEKNILTIEDPVEYELEGLTQVQINNRAGLTFPAGLRTMLRQDPDIAMVGEIRDAETATHSDRGGPDRPPGAFDAAHQRRAGRHDPNGRHGHRAVPDRFERDRRAGAEAGARCVPEVQGAVYAAARRRRTARYRG